MRRTLANRLALTLVGAVGLVLASPASSATASPPETWSDSQSDGAMEFLLVLGVIPLGLVLLITLLVFIPSMTRGRSSEPAVVFHDRSEWFGGPRRGLDDPATGEDHDDLEQGGASARW